MKLSKTNTTLLATLVVAATPLSAAKNVILMISDGAGYNVWQAASMYQGKVDSTNPLKGTQVYNGSDWVTYACATNSASMSSKPDGTIDESVVYNPTKVYDSTPEIATSGLGDFAGYNWIKATYTDSAAAATALSTGQKVYNNSMNWSSFPAGIGTSLSGRTIAEIAKAEGKAVGTISTVEFSHATPAGLGGAHNISRNSYDAIANDMLDGDWLDVIMGAGNPDYDDNGVERSKKEYKYVGGETTWNALVSGTHANGWTLVQDKSDFEKLAKPTSSTVLPKKLVGVPEVATTLQQARSGYTEDDTPASNAMNANVPDLATMSLAALNVLNQDTDGFFLHIEGGAPDWAAHANQKARLIEEQMDFNEAVEAVIAWVDANSNWNDTLLILTADHDCGMLMGPDAATVMYDDLVYNGAGKMPGMAFMSGNHTNQLVPVFAKGSDAAYFSYCVDGIDPVRGEYVDNTDIFTVMKEAIAPTPAITGYESSKNVILMISDGCGYNTWDAASYYEYGATGKQVYEGNGWVELGCSTYMATPYHEGKNTVPSGFILERNVYDPLKAWDNTAAGYVYDNDETGAFTGYNWLKQTPTDSASAATALSTGYKTYNGAINWSNWPAITGTELTGKTLAEYAHAWGRKVGTITSVEFSHATPAGLGGAHNFSRNNYAAIANEMLDSDWLSVIMGAGNPNYDDNGTERSKKEYKYVGGESTWTTLASGTHANGWTLIQDKSAFENIAKATSSASIPTKLVGVAKVATTLQQGRSGYGSGDVPYSDAFNANVPDLATMSLAALKVLDKDDKGFFLHIEGGAIDWAAHANQGSRLIEEQVDFNKAVAAVVNWIETNSSWDETTLIITADHECGMVWGPNSATAAYDPVVNNGVGKMPSLAFNSASHSNQLVPVYARGSGAKLLQNMAVGYDPVRGEYVDNTDVFTAIYNVMSPKRASNFLAEGAIEYNDGWKNTSWFTTFFDASYPWILAPSISSDWIYVADGSTAENMWFYTQENGWCWTARNWYPWCWKQSTKTWLHQE